jgi:hypothetical protein
MAMNWAVAEAAAFHGGSCEDEQEADEAAFAEYQRRMRATPTEPVHKNASAVMAAEHRAMRERERVRQQEKLQREQRENERSASLLGREFGLPAEVTHGILGHVGKPSGTRQFEYGRTQHAQIESEHERRMRVRAGIVALDKRIGTYHDELAGGSSLTDERRWDELAAVSGDEARAAIESNDKMHAAESKEFLQMFRM